MPHLILNELSFQVFPDGGAPAAPDQETAWKWMSTLIESLREGRRRNWVLALRVAEDFYLLELSAGYGLTDWRNDRRVNRDERVFFRSLAAAYPYLTRLDHDVRIGNLSSSGLACCVELEGIALSWMSNVVWESAHIKVSLDWLNADGSVATNTREVRNIARTEHWAAHADSIRKELMEEIRTGLQIIEKAGSAFTHLEFCPTVIAQIEQMTGHERFFKWLVSALMDAEIEAERWTGGLFPHDRLPGPASGESKTVHQDETLRELRVFTTQDGRELMFEHHMKNNAENFRIHYLFEAARSTLMIGYAGPHLPTSKY